MEDWKEEKEEHSEEYFEEEKVSFFDSFPIKLLFSVLLIVSLVYISGIREYFFYRRTPTTTEVRTSEALVDAERIMAQVRVFVVREGPFLSQRTEEETDHILQNGFRVFNQANIHFKVVDYSEIFVNSEMFLYNHRYFLSQVDGYDSRIINIFLVGNLKGLNGVAFTGLNSLAVADYVTSRDYRVLAHEIGHLLGLGHSNNPSSVMYQGSFGINLSLEEALTARERAKKMETK